MKIKRTKDGEITAEMVVTIGDGEDTQVVKFEFAAAGTLTDHREVDNEAA